MTDDHLNALRDMAHEASRKRKGGTWEADKMPMVKPLRSILERRLKERTQREWVFFNERTGDRYYHRPKLMDAICRRAGLEPLEVTKRRIRGKVKDYPLYYNFHDLRHYGAHLLAQDPDVTLAMISKMLRHRELRTTEIYLKSLDQSVKAAGEKLAEKLSLSHANLDEIEAKPRNDTPQSKDKGATP